MSMDVKRISRWLFLTLATFVLNGTSLAQCTGKPILKVSYEGIGMVTNGKHLYLLVCRSGEVEYDNGHFDSEHRKKDHLTTKQQAELATLLDDKGTRSLTGSYRGVVEWAMDHHEWVDIAIFGPKRHQQFTATDFYGRTEKIYPPPLVTFLCGIDKLRTQTDWRISVVFDCPAD